MIRQHGVRGMTAPVAVGLLLLLGCSGKSDIIPMSLNPKPPTESNGTGQVVKSMSGPRVTVIPFEDGRADRTNVGSRSSMWGGESYFNVPSGSAGEATAQAFADYLKGKGWQAQYAKSEPPASESGPDIVLSGKILDLAVEAKRGFMLTDIEAKSKLVIQASNRQDHSSLTRTDAHSGSHDNVLWFEPQDGEQILSEVLEKNFERFVVNTKFEDRTIRFR
ncbi:MAG: hypothetical protein HY348_12165 [Nitrospira defluvii]|nr:hypothetical protein [Nitrospira defluvii]